MKTNDRTEPVPPAARWAGTGDAGRSSASRRIRWTAAAAGAVLALAPLAACGSDAVASESAGSSDASSGESGADAADALADCLAENGIELDGSAADGEARAGGADRDALAQAREACGDLMGDGAPRGAGVRPDTEGMQEWAACLAENGVEVTQSGPAGGQPGPPESGQAPADGDTPADRQPPADGQERTGSGVPFGLDTSDPDVAAAMDACADLQPDIGTPPDADAPPATGGGTGGGTDGATGQSEGTNT